jgi:hypothetical protein
MNEIFRLLLDFYDGYHFGGDLKVFNGAWTAGELFAASLQN